MRTQALTTLRTALSRCAALLLISQTPMTWAQSDTPAGVMQEASGREYPSINITAPAPHYRQFDKVEIIGSAILAKEAKAALPVQVLDRRDIERSGATQLSSFLQQLPVMHNFLERGGLAGTTMGGPESLAVHGNQSGTLVLLNGRRLPYYGSQTVFGERAVVDVNFVPLAAVEKIEILTDGSSSRYGSDAVAGVVNIVTRSQQKGVVLWADKWMPQERGGQGQAVSLLFGSGQRQQDGYSITGALSLEKQQALLAGDRSTSSQGATPFIVNGKTWWWSTPNLTYFSAPGRNYLDAQGQLRNDTLINTGSCGTGWYEVTRGECQRNAQPWQTIYPHENKARAYLRAEKDLSGDWVGSVELVASQYTQRYQEVIPGMGESIYFMPEDADRQRTYLMTGTPWGQVERTNDNRMYQGSVGLRGALGEWEITSHASVGRHVVQRTYSNGMVTSGWDKLNFPAAEIGVDPSNYSVATRAEFDKYKRRTDRLIDDGSTRLDSYSLLASRELGETGDGPVALGLGIDYRREHVDYMPGPLEGGRQAFEAQRSIWAGFAELQAHLAPQMEGLAALRHDRYSDFGGVTTGKLGWKWQPRAGWTLRSTWGTGFRAPTLAQMVPVRQAYTAYDDAQLGRVNMLNQGNPDLQPERSQQTMFGIRYEPSPRWSAGADLWNLKIQDTFGTLDSEIILADDALRQQYWDPVQHNLMLQNLNLGRSLARGIDYDVQWRQPLDSGRLRIILRGTHMLRSEFQPSAGMPMESNLGVYKGSDAVARDQLLMSTLYETADWSAGASWRYRSGNSETVGLTDIDGGRMLYTRHVSGYGTIDVFGRMQMARRTSLTARISNVGNKMPPLRLLTRNVLNGVDTRYGSYEGRALYLRLEHRFF